MSQDGGSRSLLDGGPSVQPGPHEAGIRVCALKLAAGRAAHMGPGGIRAVPWRAMGNHQGLLKPGLGVTVHVWGGGM